MNLQVGLHLSINSFQVNSPCMSEEFSPLSTPSSQLQQTFSSSIKLNADSQITQSSISSLSHLKAMSLIFKLERLKINNLNKGFKSIQMKKLNSPIILFPFFGMGSDKKQTSSTKTSLGELSTLSQNLQSNQQQTLTLTTKFSIQLEEKCEKNSLKFLKKEIFMQKLIISQKQSEIKSLQQQLAQSQRRQLKQQRKKKQSLQSLAEQLGQKSEYIQQLKSVIRGLESKLNIPQAELMILQEDAQTLRRNVERLEGVNDKLNHDLQKIKEYYETSNANNKQLLEQNLHLKNQIKHLKEEFFEIECDRRKNKHKSQQIEAWERKLILRQKRIKIIEQRDDKSQLILHSLQNSRQNNLSILQEKIQKILSFIFHIDNPNFFFLPSQLFEKQEIQLLQSHKKRITLMEQNSSNQVNSVHNSFEGESVDISCLQMIKHAEEQSNKMQQDTIRLRLQNQKDRLIQKIADLKRRELHGRSIVLNFIKSISQKLSKQNRDTLQQVLQFFQYSQGQKIILFQAKPKKILGFF